METGKLINIGVHPLGINAQFEFWECLDCGTRYPQINGRITCNDKVISRCLCAETKPAKRKAKNE